MPHKTAPRDYRETLLLPKTSFPMQGKLPHREPEILKGWAQEDLYQQLRQARAGCEKFILHDGPPYANGHIHMGHALNKILKDIVVRSHQMTGRDATYVPGWDCHGLPIEWKVEEAFRKQGRAKESVPASEFREACRGFAQKWIQVQKEEFKRLGIMGHWQAPYTTMEPTIEAATVEEFLKFAMSGAVYRGTHPVMWSTVEKTALAEAEVEYHEHLSSTVLVAFPLNDEVSALIGPPPRGRSLATVRSLMAPTSLTVSTKHRTKDVFSWPTVLRKRRFGWHRWRRGAVSKTYLLRVSWRITRCAGKAMNLTCRSSLVTSLQKRPAPDWCTSPQVTVKMTFFSDKSIIFRFLSRWMMKGFMGRRCRCFQGVAFSPLRARQQMRTKR